MIAVFFYSCIDNCGQGIPEVNIMLGKTIKGRLGPTLKVDRERAVIMRVVCLQFCKRASAGWEWVYNQHVYVDSIYENPRFDEFRRYIVTKHQFGYADNGFVHIRLYGKSKYMYTTTDKYIRAIYDLQYHSILIIRFYSDWKDSRTVYAQWSFQYYDLEEINSNPLCYNVLTEGTATVTEFDLCNSRVKLTDYVTNLFFYNSPDFRSRDGMKNAIFLACPGIYS